MPEQRERLLNISVEQMRNFGRRNLTVGSLFLIILCALAIRLPYLDLPGPQGDEVYMPYVALQVKNGDSIWHPKIVIGDWQLPTTISSYTGALPVYIYLAILQVYYHPLLFRFVNLLYVVISIILLFGLAVDLFGSEKAGLLAACLFSVMPASVFYSRIGEFAAFSRVPIFIALALFTNKFFTTGKSFYFYLACFALGLGINIRLEAVWWIPVWIAWAIISGNRAKWLPHRPILLVKALLLGILLFLIGSTPFSVYLVKDWNDFMGYTTSYSAVTPVGVDNRMVLQNLATRFHQITMLVDGSSVSEMGQPIRKDNITLLGFYLSCIFCTFTLIKSYLSKHRFPSIEKLFSAIILITVASIITLSLFKPWHILMILPFVVLIIAFAVNQIFRWKKLFGYLLAAIFLFSSLATTWGNYEMLLRWRGYGGFSPAIYSLVEHLDQNHVRKIYTGEWGIARLVYYLSNGRIQTSGLEIYGPHPPVPDWFYDKIDKSILRKKPVWVFYTSGYGDQVSQDAFLKYLSAEKVFTDKEILSDLYGPIFNVYYLKTRKQ